MLKDLFSGSSNRAPEVHKDKLSEAKQNERDLREASKLKRQEQKQQKLESQAAEAKAYRMERSWNPQSKRAARDAREEKKHAEKQQEGFVCEHGVYKCRICHPVTKHK